MKPDERMKDYAKLWREAKSDFERERWRNKAIFAAVGLAGLVAQSGIKREMEKLRLIKVYEEATKVNP